jgi:hypothetical protein
MFLPFPIVGFILMFEEHTRELAVAGRHGNGAARVETRCRRDGSFFYPMNHAPNSLIKRRAKPGTLFAVMLCNLLGSHDFLISAHSSSQPPRPRRVELPGLRARSRHAAPLR